MRKKETYTAWGTGRASTLGKKPTEQNMQGKADETEKERGQSKTQHQKQSPNIKFWNNVIRIFIFQIMLFCAPMFFFCCSFSFFGLAKGREVL